MRSPSAGVFFLVDIYKVIYCVIERAKGVPCKLFFVDFPPSTWRPCALVAALGQELGKVASASVRYGVWMRDGVGQN